MYFRLYPSEILNPITSIYVINDHGALTPHIMFSWSENTSQSKEETDALTDKTEQVSFGMKQSFSFKMLESFKKTQNNKCCFVAVVTDRCSASVQAVCEQTSYSMKSI